MRRAPAVLALFAGLAGLGVGPAAAGEREAVLTSQRFVVFDDFDTNLNDALIAAGVARRFEKPELFAAGDEVACFEALPPSARAAWQAAAGWYAEIVAPAEWNARQQYLLRLDLAAVPRANETEGDRQFVEIARGLRAAAAPAYRACRWEKQAAKNEAWIAALAADLARFEAVVAPRLARVYRKAWSGPLLVDIVETVNWAGANSTFPDGVGGHLLISSANPPEAALELVFHEASHGLMLPGDPLFEALAGVGRAAGVEPPRDLWHPVLFFTTGEVVRAALAEGGRAGYAPMVEEIYPRSPWGAWREAIAREWAPYVRGERELDAAALALVAAVGPAEPKGKR